MKINWKMIEHDLLDEISIPSCPAMFRREAQNIIRIISSTQFSEYQTISNFDKQLIYEYWKQIDGMEAVLHDFAEYRKWFLEKATEPEKIRRARQWLIERNFIIPRSCVSDRAQKAGENWRAGVK